VYCNYIFSHNHKPVDDLARAAAKLFQSSKPNELILNTTFYDSVYLKGPHG